MDCINSIEDLKAYFNSMENSLEPLLCKKLNTYFLSKHDFYTFLSGRGKGVVMGFHVCMSEQYLPSLMTLIERDLCEAQFPLRGGLDQ